MNWKKEMSLQERLKYQREALKHRTKKKKISKEEDQPRLSNAEPVPFSNQLVAGFPTRRSSNQSVESEQITSFHILLLLLPILPRL